MNALTAFRSIPITPRTPKSVGMSLFALEYNPPKDFEIDLLPVSIFPMLDAPDFSTDANFFTAPDAISHIVLATVFVILDIALNTPRISSAFDSKTSASSCNPWNVSRTLAIMDCNPVAACSDP